MNEYPAAEAGTAPAHPELLSIQQVLCPWTEQFHQLMIHMLIRVCSTSKCAEQECVFANILPAENLACDSALHNNFTESVGNSSKKQSQAFSVTAPF